jgi:hypothetical protein
MNLINANFARKWDADLITELPTFKQDIMETAAEPTRWEKAYAVYMQENSEDDPEGEDFEYILAENVEDQAGMSERDGGILMARKVCRILGFPYRTKDDLDQLDLF